MSSTIDDLNVLYSRACQAWKEFCDTRKQEPYYIAIIEYIQRNINDRGIIRDWFLEKLHPVPKEIVPPELMEFCMHALQWQDMYDPIHKLYIESSDIRRRTFLEHILESFSESWDDKVLFDYFNK